MRYTITFLLTITVLYFSGCLAVLQNPKQTLNDVKEHNVTFDAIIVPGSPYTNGSWDSLMKGRVTWAWILYKNGITKNIIFSGGAVYSPYYEAKIMGLYAQALGVPAEHILYDTFARHSTENIYYSYLLAKRKGYKVIALATDVVQAALLRKYTLTRLGTVIYHLPMIIDSVKHYNHLNPTIDAEQARRDGFISITDDESSFKRLFGTIGADINWKQHEGRKLPPL